MFSYKSLEKYQQKTRALSQSTIEKMRQIIKPSSKVPLSKENLNKIYDIVMESETEEEVVKKLDLLIEQRDKERAEELKRMDERIAQQEAEDRKYDDFTPRTLENYKKAVFNYLTQKSKLSTTVAKNLMKNTDLVFETYLKDGWTVSEAATDLMIG